MWRDCCCGVLTDRPGQTGRLIDKFSCRSGVLGLDPISPGRGRSGRSRGRPKGSGGAAKSGGKGRGRKSTAGSAAAMAGARAGAAAASAAAFAAAFSSYNFSVSKGQ